MTGKLGVNGSISRRGLVKEPEFVKTKDQVANAVESQFKLGKE